ncbi:MAG: hypothetical protein PHR07_08050 [Acidaminococcaceae bacterium]|nr:hypothetical protein [Acidaminococcaceae bacterium]
MAKFMGTLAPWARNEVTRVNQNGMTVVAQSWQGSVQVSMNMGIDNKVRCTITVGKGSTQHPDDRVIFSGFLEELIV